MQRNRDATQQWSYAEIPEGDQAFDTPESVSICLIHITVKVSFYTCQMKQTIEKNEPWSIPNLTLRKYPTSLKLSMTTCQVDFLLKNPV